jgi:hypothetical protein
LSLEMWPHHRGSRSHLQWRPSPRLNRRRRNWRCSRLLGWVSPMSRLAMRRPRRARPLGASRGFLMRCGSSGSRPWLSLHHDSRREPGGLCLSGAGAHGLSPNRWHTYRPPGGARYSSCSGWGLRRRPLQFHLRPRGYSTPCVLGPCHRVRWRPLMRCFQRSMGARASSSWKTRRVRWCSHVGCSIYVIWNRGAVC